MNQSTLKLEVLKEFPNQVFIETGTAKGEGILIALEAGFSEVYSIEANPEVYVTGCNRFKDDNRVTLLMGDSGVVLPHLLEGIKCPATFWLDAHWSTGECDLGPSVNKCPVLHDLRAIALHPIKNHVILVDDIRYFRTGGIPQWNMVSLGDIMEVVMEINPNYRMDFREGHVENDVLVCAVEE